MRIERLEQALHEINRFGQTDCGVTRLAYSSAERQAVHDVAAQCEREGLSVRLDPCGNMIARREGLYPDWPAVAMGSHLDTVAQGGRYDGALGVAAALEVVRSLNERGVRTEHPIELIVFACEESARFGVSTVGSKAMAGALNEEALRRFTDRDGLSMAEAMADCGLSAGRLAECARAKKELKAFFELHIEQGPVLEQLNMPIGLATGISAPSRYTVQVQGRASHSGTTPMTGRKDAFLGAAEIALALEKAAKAEAAFGTVATTGVCEVKPGAMNVVPDAAELKLEVRGLSTASKERVIHRLTEAIAETGKARKLRIALQELGNETPVHLSAEVLDTLARLCGEKRLAYRLMPSGAGHDAMNMSLLCPSGLIFVPSRDGISHHPDEYTSSEQIAAGALLLERAVLYFAGISGCSTETIRTEKAL